MTTHKLPDTDGQGVLDIQYVDWITTPELVDDPTNSDARRDIKPPISRPRNAKVNNMPFYAGSSAPLTGPVSWDPPSTIPTYEDPIGTFVPSPITYSLVVRRLRVNVKADATKVVDPDATKTRARGLVVTNCLKRPRKWEKAAIVKTSPAIWTT